MASEDKRARWRKPNADSMELAMECHSSLNECIVVAGGKPLSPAALRGMTALDLITMIAPNGIVFTRTAVADGGPDTE